MAKVTVTICDACKERIAMSSCPICEIDLCKPCTKNLSMELGVKFGPRAEFFKGAMCSGCYKKVEGNYKNIIAKLSTELEPNVSKVLKDSVGTIPTREELQKQTTASASIGMSSNYKGGFESPPKDNDDYSKEVTRAELPRGMDVTKDL